MKSNLICSRHSIIIETARKPQKKTSLIPLNVAQKERSFVLSYHYLASFSIPYIFTLSTEKKTVLSDIAAVATETLEGNLFLP